MSVSMSKTDGVTILTLATDPHSACPPLCQILSSLCYSPVCCTVSQRLKNIQNGSQTILGVIQIVVGVLNIGLGAFLMCSRGGSGWTMDDTGFPYWLGVFFIIFGIVSILCDHKPSPCLLGFHVFLHLSGVVFAIAAIFLYSTNMARIRMWWMCNDDYGYRYGYRDRYRFTTARPSHKEEEYLKEKCLEAKELILIVLRGINAVLIIVCVLELCVTISCVVLGIKTLRNKGSGPKKTPEDPEIFKALLEEVRATPSS